MWCSLQIAANLYINAIASIAGIAPSTMYPVDNSIYNLALGLERLIEINLI